MVSPGRQLILAGPGSGKTRVITEKILYLIENRHARPDQILALTFSDKAASEMQERIDRAGDLTAGCTVQTFHSFCYTLLKDHTLESGRSLTNGLINRTSQIVWGQRNIDNFGFRYIKVGNNAARVIESIMDGISSLRDELITPEELEDYIRLSSGKSPSPEDELEIQRLSDLLRVYHAYENYKMNERRIDFDDMIQEAVSLLERRPLVREQLRQQYPCILVDEFQDTNYAQLALVKALCGENLCVVGDDDQTIYRFRGAYHGNVTDFTETYPDHSLTLLNQNYRNSGTILALARQLIDHNPERSQKDLRTLNPDGEPVIVAECENEAAEATFVAGEIRRLLGAGISGYGDIAILCRQRSHGQKFYQQLVNDGIPCEFVGDADHFRFPPVRDLIATLRVVDDPLNAGIPINRLLRRAGITEITVQGINRQATECADKEHDNDGVCEALLKNADPEVQEFADHLSGIIEMKTSLQIPELVYSLMMESGGLYYSVLRDGNQKEQRVLDWFYRLATEYTALTKEPTIADFLVYLDQVGEISVDMEEETGEEAVHIMTIHQSKGKEFPVVFIVDLSEDKFPVRYRGKTFTVPKDLAKGILPEEDEHELSLQEERRLCYVAMTRAGKRLYMTRTARYDGRKRDTKPSRFLNDLEYTTNPLIRVIEVPAPERMADGVMLSDLEMAEQQLQKEAIRAVAGMRLSAAVQRLMSLEKCRLLRAGEDTLSFDRERFLSVPEAPFDIEVAARKRLEPGLNDEVRLSASAISTYESCPLRFRFGTLLRVPQRPRPFFSLGSTVHRVFELMARQKMNGVIPTLDLALSVLDQEWSSAGYTSEKAEKEEHEKAEEMVATYIDWELSNQNEIVDLERKFEFIFDGARFRGYIDRIEQTPEGRYVVVDYKSGGRNGITKKGLPENIQLNIYCLAVRELFGEYPEEAGFFFVKDNKHWSYRPTAELIDLFRARLLEDIRRIRAGEFPAVRAYDCNHCDYQALCEEWERVE